MQHWTKGTNLLEETMNAIDDSGHTPEDVIFVGSADGKYGLSWNAFVSIANVNYDSSYGSPEVATDLVVRFSDGRGMWRGEYDGSEWWEYDVATQVEYDPFKATPMRSVIDGPGYSFTVAGIYESGDDAKE